VHPVGIEVGQGGLVADVFEGFGRLGVDEAARTPPAGLFCRSGERHVGGGCTQSARVGITSEAEAGSTVEEYG